MAKAAARTSVAPLVAFAGLLTMFVSQFSFYRYQESFLLRPQQASTLLVDEQSPAVVRPHTALTPLTEITESFKTIQCPEGLVNVPDTVLDPALAWTNHRKIPRVVHVTSRSRCMHPVFAENLDKWRLPDHSFFMHDDDALDKLLYRHWPEFPNLQKVLQCLKYGGAAKADLWRLLVLYEYGGIYTDIDNAPNKFNATTLDPEDDSFFVIEIAGIPSQWFMATSPHHPVMFLAVQTVLHSLLNMEDTGLLRIVWTTGPGAIQTAFSKFQRNGEKPVAGHYVGTDGRTARLVGDKKDQDEYVLRNMIKKKEDLYEKMNMTHITRMDMMKTGSNRSCFEQLYHEERNTIERVNMW